jgi:large subunit ribosomal protein L10
MSNPAKEQQIADLSQRLDATRTIFLTDYTGMDVTTVTRLRNQLRQSGAEYRVVKNTLTKLACSQLHKEDLGGLIDGPSGLVLIDGEDPVGPAKVLTAFIKENDRPVIKAGYDGSPRDDKWVELLATIPKKEVLVSQLLGLLSLPLRRLVNVLSAPPRNLVMTLDAIAGRDRSGSEPGQSDTPSS